MSKEIQLTRGYVTIVDDRNYEWLNRWKWHVSGNGKYVYACRQVRHPTIRNTKGHAKQIHVSMARLIMGAQPDQNIDHMNHDTLNNLESNLRLCTHAENLQNQQSHKLYKGICESRISKTGRRWVAKIGKDRKCHELGTFKSPQDAARAYDRAAIDLFGDFAFTNFGSEIYNDPAFRVK